MGQASFALFDEDVRALEQQMLPAAGPPSSGGRGDRQAGLVEPDFEGLAAARRNATVGCAR
jgi:hypothetical protein